jgi:hypothetical protein
MGIIRAIPSAFAIASARLRSAHRAGLKSPRLNVGTMSTSDELGMVCS